MKLDLAAGVEVQISLELIRAELSHAKELDSDSLPRRRLKKRIRSRPKGSDREPAKGVSRARLPTRIGGEAQHALFSCRACNFYSSALRRVGQKDG